MKTFFHGFKCLRRFLFFLKKEPSRISPVPIRHYYCFGWICTRNREKELRTLSPYEFAKYSREIESHITRKYAIRKKIGQGAYGTVWHSIDRNDGKQVAIKRITEAFRNERDAKRTFREIFCLKNLGAHKNIIKCGIDSDMYLVFEHMETDLHAVCRSNQLKTIHNYYVLYQIFCTLQYMHSKDIIHRDIKPSNILMNQDCQIKLADFGLARRVFCNTIRNYACDLTSYVATRWYRAPEILLKSKTYSKAVDIWSVGCITGELFLRHVLFPGTSSAHQIRIILENTNLHPVSWDLKNMSHANFMDMISDAKFEHFSTKLMHRKPLIKLLRRQLACDPQKRITATNGLRDINFRRFMDKTRENKIIESDQVQNFNRNFDFFTQNTFSLAYFEGKTLQEYRECLYAEILKEKHLLSNWSTPQVIKKQF